MTDHVPVNADSTNMILNRVQEIFRNELDDDALVIKLETRRTRTKSWDSLAHIRLISGVEHEFNIQFSLVEIEHIDSVQQLVDVIQKHLASTG